MHFTINLHNQLYINILYGHPQASSDAHWFRMVGIAGSGESAAVCRRKFPPENSPRGKPEDYPEKDWEDGTGHHRRYDCRLHGDTQGIGRPSLEIGRYYQISPGYSSGQKDYSPHRSRQRRSLEGAYQEIAVLIKDNSASCTTIHRIKLSTKRETSHTNTARNHVQTCLLHVFVCYCPFRNYKTM